MHTHTHTHPSHAHKAVRDKLGYGADATAAFVVDGGDGWTKYFATSLGYFAGMSLLLMKGNPSRTAREQAADVAPTHRSCVCYM